MIIRSIALLATTSVLLACQSNPPAPSDATSVSYTRVATLPSGASAVTGDALDAAIRGSAFEGVSDSGYIYYGRYAADGSGALAFEGGDIYRFTWRQTGDQICSDFGEGEDCSQAVLHNGWLLFYDETTVVAQIRVIDDPDLPEWAEI